MPDALHFLLDFILHVDVHLQTFVHSYGAWVYALLFLIIFVETGVVVMPFLPGDSLLFVVGTLCGVGLMSLPLSMALLTAAAILGNQTNYTIGHHIGPRVFQWEQSRFFNKRAFEQAHEFYERYGGITIVLARFMPFVRTFAPFVAGVAQMTRRRFTLYDVTGGTLWVVQPGRCRLPVRQHPVRQEPPRQDHLGDDPDPRADRDLRRLEGAARAALSERQRPGLARRTRPPALPRHVAARRKRRRRRGLRASGPACDAAACAAAKKPAHELGQQRGVERGGLGPRQHAHDGRFDARRRLESVGGHVEQRLDVVAPLQHHRQAPVVLDRRAPRPCARRPPFAA